jgi:exosortase/archaeosortase family protein
VGLALVVYVAWYALYEGLVRPDGRLDAWLSNAVAAAAGGLLSLAGAGVERAGAVLRMPGSAGVVVEPGCNGLSTLGLFAGFVVAYAGPWRRRAWFVPLGLLAILGANVLRVTALTALEPAWPAAFAALHDLGATTFFYGVVLVLWWAWASLVDGRLARLLERRPAEAALAAAA